MVQSGTALMDLLGLGKLVNFFSIKVYLVQIPQFYSLYYDCSTSILAIILYFTLLYHVTQYLFLVVTRSEHLYLYSMNDVSPFK